MQGRHGRGPARFCALRPRLREVDLNGSPGVNVPKGRRSFPRMFACTARPEQLKNNVSARVDICRCASGEWVSLAQPRSIAEKYFWRKLEFLTYFAMERFLRRLSRTLQDRRGNTRDGSRGSSSDGATKDEYSGFDFQSSLACRSRRSKPIPMKGKIGGSTFIEVVVVSLMTLPL